VNTKPVVLAAVFAALLGTFAEANDKVNFVQEEEYDFVSDTTKSFATLSIKSNEDENVSFCVLMQDKGCGWGLVNENPFRWANFKDELNVTFRGSAHPASMEITMNGSGATRISGHHFVKNSFLKSDKIGFRVEGKTYTFDLLSRDVQKAKAVFKNSPNYMTSLLPN